MKTDPDTIASALHLFFGAGEVFEARALGADGNARWQKSVFLRGRDIDRLAGRLAREADSALGGLHFTPHGLAVDVLKRGNCVIAPVLKNKKGETAPRLTHDEDVPRRRFLILDVDPVRAKGHAGDSATAEEKNEAWRVLRSAVAALSAAGWKMPLVVDSGNGFHAYFRLADAEPGGPVSCTVDPIRRTLAVLGRRCDSPAAKIDTNVFNAGRTMRVPGTPSRKGPGTADRPHRFSLILSVPPIWNQ